MAMDRIHADPGRHQKLEAEMHEKLGVKVIPGLGSARIHSAECMRIVAFCVRAFSLCERAQKPPGTGQGEQTMKNKLKI